MNWKLRARKLAIPLLEESLEQEQQNWTRQDISFEQHAAQVLSEHEQLKSAHLARIERAVALLQKRFGI